MGDDNVDNNNADSGHNNESITLIAKLGKECIEIKDLHPSTTIGEVKDMLLAKHTNIIREEGTTSHTKLHIEIMPSNKKQKIQQDESISPSSSSSSSSVIIPEDVIRAYILPYMAHLKQIDNVVKLIEKDDNGSETKRNERINKEILRDCAKRGELSGIHYICSKYSDSLTRHGIYFAFYAACGTGYLEIVRYLCELKDEKGRLRCDASGRKNFALPNAAKEGHLNIVKYLCELKNNNGRYTCDPSDENNKAIRWAAEFGRLNVVKYLCEIKNDDGVYRCDPSDGGYPAFQNKNDAIIEASRRGHLNIVKYLCEIKNNDGTYRCNPYDYDNDAIQAGALFGHLNIVKYFCEIKNHDGTYRCNPSEVGDSTCIQIAQRKGHLDIVNYLRGLTNNDGTLRCPK